MTTPRSKIEFLVRSPSGETFETREVPSYAAYLQSRPKRIPTDQWELNRLPTGIDGTPKYALKNRNAERILQITEPQRFLWEQMDGRASLQELGVAYVLRYGAFDFDIIPELIGELRKAELLTMRPASRLREVLARHHRNPAARAAEAALKALERLTVSTRTANGMFERLYRYGGFLLFSPFALVLLAAVTVLGFRGATALWGQSAQITAALARDPLVAIVLVKAFFWLTVVTHQMMHGLALVHYKRRVREFGFTMLHGFIPTFFVDVTDVFMANRRARIVNALSGPLVHLFLGVFYLWMGSLITPGLLQAFLAASGILQLQSFFVSLYPFCFLEMDGYHILADLLGMSSLKHDSVHFVRHSLWERLKQGIGFARQDWVYLGYFVVSVVSVVAFVAVNVLLLVQASRS